MAKGERKVKDRVLIFKNGEDSPIAELSPEAPMPEVSGDRVEAVLTAMTEVRVKLNCYLDDEEAWAVYEDAIGVKRVTVGAPTIGQAASFLVMLRLHGWFDRAVSLDDFKRSSDPRDQGRYRRWQVAIAESKGTVGDDNRRSAA